MDAGKKKIARSRRVFRKSYSAAWCAWNGFTVSLGDMKAEAIAGAIKRASELYRKIGHKSTEIRDALDRLVPDLRGDGIRSADLRGGVFCAGRRNGSCGI